jgi:flagellar FliJ protein
MKKYTFRLEAVLKIRKFKEEACRMELGQLIQSLNKINAQLDHDRREIEHYYEIQESSLKTGMKGSQIQAFPMLIMAKEKNIEILGKERIKQEQLISDKKIELAQVRGELKVMENLKDKDYDQYRKALNKENDQKVEEQTQNWLQSKEKKASV